MPLLPEVLERRGQGVVLEEEVAKSMMVHQTLGEDEVSKRNVSQE